MYPADTVHAVFDGPDNMRGLVDEIKRLTETIVNRSVFPKFIPGSSDNVEPEVGSSSRTSSVRPDNLVASSLASEIPSLSFAQRNINSDQTLSSTHSSSPSTHSPSPSTNCPAESLPSLSSFCSPSCYPTTTADTPSSFSTTDTPSSLFTSSTSSTSLTSSTSSTSSTTTSPSTTSDFPYPYIGPWTPSELSQLRHLVQSTSSHSQIDWTIIAQKLGARRNKRQVLLKATQLGLKGASPL
ncbi:hypothetical protein BCR39DRAFT_514968 [Naematelia encephala]|uniref:Uncharacterized protein n=1 Tax=Naematelia encephala TaxID=71784 RepID=A0A1Y2BJ55_9TREE|nr:hypothetical protein BCR39DRAFT_514968 [Naematelia encephala]